MQVKYGFRELLDRFFNIRKGRASYSTIRKGVVAGMQVDGIHVCSLIVAMMIASIGLNMNSTEVVIGAMLICPIMGSVLGISYSIATADREMLRHAVAVLVSQIVVSLATSTIYFLVSPISQITPMLTGNSTATIWDVVIALGGGFAGALGASRKQVPSTLIAGVAVATALMPPLCSAGYGLASRDLMFMVSALYEFLLNVVFIAFGAEIVFLVLHVPMRYEDRDGDGVVSDEDKLLSQKQAKRLRRRLIIGSLAFLAPCVLISAGVVQKAMDDTGTIVEVQDTYSTARLTKELKAICPVLDSYRIGPADSYDSGEDKFKQEIVAFVTTRVEIPYSARHQIEDLIAINVPGVSEVVFSVSEDDFVGPMPKGMFVGAEASV